MVTFSPDAYAELCRRVAALDEPDPGVAVVWVPAQKDIVRTPEGKAAWIEPYPDKWLVGAMSLEDFPTPEKIQYVGDLRVYFHPEGSGAREVTVEFDGEFRVRPIDA